MPRIATRPGIVLAVLSCALGLAHGGTTDGPAPTPLHHWTFDAPELRDAVTGAVASTPQELPRVGGVLGQALELKGSHAISTPGPRGHNLDGLTLSAWVRPVDLGGFREIFRRECGHRMLFSFQENGSILSLGLDVGGYVECDAPIDAASVLDGRWHHVAARFDGTTMRVDLDGRTVGTLARPGRAANDPDIPAFIGSLGGQSEPFQGGLDDLRIYGESLSDDTLAALLRDGREALALAAAERERQLGAVYERAPGFAATFAATLRNLRARGGAADPELARVAAERLAADFPEPYAALTRLGGATPAALLASAEPDGLIREARRAVGLLVEYRPLTPEQLRRQTPEEARHWEQATRLEERFQRLVADGTDPVAPAWIDLVLEAGPMVQLRPSQREAVAPFVEPATPATRDLGAEEGRAALERDWLFQCDGAPTPARIADELRWARELAERLAGLAPGRLDFQSELAALAALEPRIAALGGPDPDLYFRVREIKRRIALRNPRIDFEEVLLVDGPYPQGSEWQHETRHRLGHMAVPGGRLLVLAGLRPDGHVRKLAPVEPLHGSFWRPELSYDGRRVIFCFKPHNEKSFHLYEIGIDGTGLRQLTEGPYDDLDPIELPDGHLLFSTTRANTYVRCMPPTNAFVLARCDADGRNIYVVSSNNEPDYLPTVLNDGRVIYTRWEYTDKPVWRLQKLWTVHPDGTMAQLFWGNQSVWPDLLKDARAIPGSRRVLFTGSAHHDWFAGSIGIIDPDGGSNFPHGLSKVTADVPWPECGNGPVDPIECADYHRSGAYDAYMSPYPLGEGDFLVSARREGRFRLYLMDVQGNRELIYEGTHHVFHAQPVRARTRPPVLADHVAWPGRERAADPEPGVIFSGNVYQGAPPELQGRARSLRVLHIDPKTYTYWSKRPYVSTGPVVSAVQSEGVKRLLGTVPIEPDGSVSFRVPPGQALHFQLLDERGRALQTMRSFVGVMPGERRGCLGCHESHSRTPTAGIDGLALRREPSPITPPPWPDTTVSYPRYVQPTLDRYCGGCHQGEGEARAVLDLTFRPAPEEALSEPYLTLVGRPTWGQPYQPPASPPPGFGIADTLLVEGFGTTDPAAYATPRPMERLSYASRLVALCDSGAHHGVKLDPQSLERLIVWVDAMCPYRGDEEVRALDDPDFPGIEWLPVRPLIRTAPRPVRPGPFDQGGGPQSGP